MKLIADLRIVLLVHLLKNEKKKIKETGDSRYIYYNELDKACCQHYMTYADLIDLNRRTAADKVLCNEAFNIAKYPKLIDIKVDLLQWSIIFLIKKLLVVAVKTFPIKNYYKNYTNSFLENSIKRKYTHLL